MKNQVVRARIEGSLKTEALEVLASHRLDLSDAIRLFLRQVVARRGIPFPIRNPRDPGMRRPRAIARLRAAILLQVSYF
jgi:DNA-damage-inducible protein J